MNLGAMAFPSGRVVTTMIMDVLLDTDLAKAGVSPEGGSCAYIEVPSQYNQIEIIAHGKSFGTGVNAGSWYIFFNDDRTHANYKIIGNQTEGSNAAYHDNWPLLGRICGTDTPLGTDSSSVRLLIPGVNLAGIRKNVFSFAGLRRNTNHNGDGLAQYNFGIFWQSAAAINPITKIEFGNWGQKMQVNSRVQVLGYRNARIVLAE